jgi:hypothetical protein
VTGATSNLTSSTIVTSFGEESATRTSTSAALLSSFKVIACDDDDGSNNSDSDSSVGESQFFDALERKPIEVIKMGNRKLKSKHG